MDYLKIGILAAVVIAVGAAFGSVLATYKKVDTLKAEVARLERSNEELVADALVCSDEIERQGVEVEKWKTAAVAAAERGAAVVKQTNAAAAARRAEDRKVKPEAEAMNKWLNDLFFLPLR
jgi:hypothetical protein